MKFKTRQAASLLLLTVLLCGTVAACSDDIHTQTPIQTDHTVSFAATEATEEIPYAFAQSELDFGGYKFRVFTETPADVDVHKEDLVAGDIVSEAVYDRNQRVEELLNIEIDSILFQAVDWEDVPAEIMKSVMAGDDAYDAVDFPVISLFRASSESNLLALDEIGTLDTSAPWWDQSVFEAFDFGNGKVYMMNGGIHYWDDYGLSCLIANVDLMERNEMTLPYDAVRAGQWDYEMFYGYMKGFERDLNGDGTWDADDQYGGIFDIDLATYLCGGFDSPSILKDEQGRPEFRLDEKFYDSVSKVVDVLCNDPSVVIIERVFGYEIGERIFDKGNSLFKSTTVAGIQSLRDVSFAYTVLPMPKYDKNQESYKNIAKHYFTFVYSVPITNTDTDRTGYILDAMGYFGDKIIRPAAIENQCKIKGAPDPDTVDMLNIIFDAKTYDLSYITAWGNWYQEMWNFVKSGKNNLASREKAFSKRVTRDIENSLEAFGIS